MLSAICFFLFTRESESARGLYF